MTTLVVYYSLSGTTRAVAEALAKNLGADIESLRCDRYNGVSAWFRAPYDNWTGYTPPLAALSHDISRYDCVAVGGPIWFWRPAAPIRSFVMKEASRLPDLAFFLTHGGSAGEKSLKEMEQLAGKRPLASLVVRAAEVKADAFRSKVASFASALRQPPPKAHAA